MEKFLCFSCVLVCINSLSYFHDTSSLSIYASFIELLLPRVFRLYIDILGDVWIKNHHHNITVNFALCFSLLHTISYCSIYFRIYFFVYLLIDIYISYVMNVHFFFNHPSHLSIERKCDLICWFSNMMWLRTKCFKLGKEGKGAAGRPNTACRRTVRVER